MNDALICPPDDDIVESSFEPKIPLRPIGKTERTRWGEHLRREAKRLLFLADRLNPEDKTFTIVEGSTMTILTKRLDKAIELINSQAGSINKLQHDNIDKDNLLRNKDEVINNHSHNIESLNKAVQDANNMINQLQESVKNADDTITQLQESSARKDKQIVDLTNNSVTLQSQLDKIREFLGELPDQDDANKLTEFDKTLDLHNEQK